MLTLILAMSIGAEPQQTFVVTNKCPQTFVVLNKIECVDNCENGQCQITQVVNKVSGNDYKYKNHIVSWYGVRINEDSSDALVSVHTGDGKGYVIRLKSDLLYLNGERYDSRCAVQFPKDKYSEELTMWMVWTGPCKLAVSNGEYHFSSLTGEELNYHLEHSYKDFNKLSAEQQRYHKREDLVYSWFNPRLKTMSDCRVAWIEWDRTHPNGWDGNPPKSMIRTVSNSIKTPIPQQYKVTNSVGDGHTHTCANGHTWNHATNPTHNCQVCGLPQYVQDSTPRAVSQQNYQAPTYSSQLGGCANGQCQSYSPTQTQMSNSGGWYLGKNLRGR